MKVLMYNNVYSLTKTKYDYKQIEKIEQLYTHESYLKAVAKLFGLTALPFEVMTSKQATSLISYGKHLRNKRLEKIAAKPYNTIWNALIGGT